LKFQEKPNKKRKWYKKRIQLLKIYKNMKRDEKKGENGKKLAKFNLCAMNLPVRAISRQ
jgi:hypothetical protein